MSRYVSIPEGRDAYQQALHLHELGLTYPAICIVLAEYHGLRDLNVNSIRNVCRLHGATPRPRGMAIQEILQRQAAA